MVARYGQVALFHLAQDVEVPIATPTPGANAFAVDTASTLQVGPRRRQRLGAAWDERGAGAAAHNRSPTCARDTDPLPRAPWCSARSALGCPTTAWW